MKTSMMEPTGDEEMARRLDLLERASRHWKYTSIACMAVAIVSMALVLASFVRWTAGPKLVEAQGFVLKNPKGEILADLGIRVNGYAFLTFYGKDGKDRILIGLESEDNSGVHILGQGKSRASMLVSGDGGGMNFYDQWGTSRTSVGLGKDNSTGMIVYDREGKDRALFGMWKDESAGINVFNSKVGSRARATLGVNPDGTPMLLLRDAEGEPLFEEPKSFREGERKSVSELRGNRCQN